MLVIPPIQPQKILHTLNLRVSKQSTLCDSGDRSLTFGVYFNFNKNIRKNSLL